MKSSLRISTVSERFWSCLEVNFPTKQRLRPAASRLLLLLWCLLFWPGVRIASAAAFDVDTVADTHDDIAGNGTCADSNGDCSLRAAIEEAVALPGDDTITIQAGTYTLTIGQLDVFSNDKLTILGADARSTIIEQTATNQRVFDLHSDLFGGTGVVELSGVTITGGNLTGDFGAGLFVNNSMTLTLSDSIITGNNGTEGGGMATGAFSTATLNRVEISGNTATQGGGVYAQTGTLTLNDTTISGNTATGAGGGIYVQKEPFFATIVNANNVTVAANMADSGDAGSESGGGIFRSDGTFNFKNSVIADNKVGTLGSDSDCFGSVESLGYNLVENTAGCTIGGTTTGNITGTDPGLGALADNGGLTNTHAVALGSEVVDKIPDGTNGCAAGVSTDQRGVTRADDPDTGTTCDMGSFEYSAAAPPTSITLGMLTAEGNHGFIVGAWPLFAALLLLLGLLSVVCLRRSSASYPFR